MSTNTQVRADAIEIRRALSILFQPGDVIELRGLDVGGKTHAGYFNDFSKLATEAARLSGQASGVYVVLNQIDSNLLARAANRIAVPSAAKPVPLTQDKDVLKRRFIPIDQDPARPTGISSNNTEHELAFAAQKKVVKFLTDIGIPEASLILADSGNGVHVLIRVDLPNDAVNTTLVQDCLKAVDLKFGDDRVLIDTSVFNAARIWKLYGTVARKGDDMTDRPHRLSRILSAPDKLVAAPIEALRRIAAMLPAEPPAPATAPHDNHRIDLKAWLAEHNISIRREKDWNGGTFFELSECPWNPEHNRGESYAIQFSNGAVDAGCHHNSCQGKHWTDLRLLFEPDYQNRRNGHKEYQPNTTLPIIAVGNRQLRDQTADALKALYEANDPPHIFRRSGALTRIGLDEKGLPFTETLTESALRGKLARVANFVRVADKGEIAIPPPLDVTRDIESLGEWQFPALSGITECPVLRHDGTVLTERGYDAATGLYYVPAPGLAVPAIPERPTDGELKAAIALVLEILCDFPFDSEASRANAYGTLLAPILRPAIAGTTPLPVIDKPQAGTGASLIADVVSIIATGHLAATMGVPQSEEEWEKKLSSHLLAGRSFCVIDNIEGKLYSDTLSRYLTSAQVSIRPLGRSADIILSNNMTFLATGNNVRLGGDMPRRCYWIRLDAGVARPWMRELNFKHPELREWAFANRGRLLASILTIARGWIIAGRPVSEGLPVLGGFENYCRTIGGILDFIGLKGFMDNLFAMYDRMDADTPQWESFLEMWHEVIGDTQITVAEFIKKLNENEDLAATLPDSLASRDGKDYSRRLGNAFSKRDGVRLPNGLMLVKGEVRHHAKTWWVGSYENANSPIGTKGGELTPLDYSKSLGMTVAQALEVWQSAGAPMIHLADGVNCLDLAKLLSQPDVSAEHLQSIRAWLESHPCPNVEGGKSDGH